MERKSFFDGNDENYTLAAADFDVLISDAIQPIIAKYADQGYSLRDMQTLINDASYDTLEEERKRIQEAGSGK